MADRYMLQRFTDRTEATRETADDLWEIARGMAVTQGGRPSMASRFAKVQNRILKATATLRRHPLPGENTPR